MDPPTKPKVLNIEVGLRVAASRLGMGTIECVAPERLIACGLQTNHFRSWSSLPGYVFVRDGKICISVALSRAWRYSERTATNFSDFRSL